MPRTTSLRLPDGMFEAVAAIARRRKMSLNSLVAELLRSAVAEEQEREMHEAASLLGEDPESDVEFALAAQSEVVLTD